MKSRIFMVAVLVLSVAMLTTGAFAYFSSAQTAQAGSISAGTLDIKLASNASSTTVPDTFYDSGVVPPWNLQNMAPGKVVDGCLWVQNTGTLDSVGVRWDFINLVNMKDGVTASVNLAERMQIKSITTSDTLYSWPAALLPGGAWYAGGFYDENSDGKISLGEMSRWSNRTPAGTFDWANDAEATFLTVEPGDKGYVCMTLEMMNGTPAEDNPYQGVGLTYDVTVTANNPAISGTTP